MQESDTNSRINLGKLLNRDRIHNLAVIATSVVLAVGAGELYSDVRTLNNGEPLRQTGDPTELVTQPIARAMHDIGIFFPTE